MFRWHKFADRILDLCDDLLVSGAKSDRFSMDKNLGKKDPSPTELCMLRSTRKISISIYIFSLCISSDSLRIYNHVADLFRKMARSHINSPADILFGLRLYIGSDYIILQCCCRMLQLLWLSFHNLAASAINGVTYSFPRSYDLFHSALPLSIISIP
jgi:hypothetical protein